MGHKHKYRKLRAFTLLEILLYISITSVILLSCSIFFGLLIQSKLKNQSITETEQAGTQIMQLISQTIRNADSINSPLPGSTSSSLSLNVTDKANNPTIFKLDGTVITRMEGNTMSIPLSSSKLMVTELDFQNLSRENTSGTIRIKFTLDRISPVSRNELKYSQTFIGSATLRLN